MTGSLSRSLARFLLVSTLGCFLGLTYAAAQFIDAPGYSVGGTPEFIVSADFNRDGNIDLAVVNDGGTVGILLGLGNGRFQSAVNYKVGLSPLALAVGDLNGDGNPDIVVANTGNSNSGSLSVLLGNGDGTFQTAINSNPGGDPRSIAIADFDGDGRLDLAVIDLTPTNLPLSVLRGNGDGTFQAAVNYAAGVAPTAVVAGDFNGDGTPDVGIADDGYATKMGGVQVLLNNGNGTFQTPVFYPAGGDAWHIAAADVNGDGVLDLAVVHLLTPAGVSVLLGNGDGSFALKANYFAGIQPRFVAAADFNSDGKLDLAVTDYYSNSAVVFAGNGDGTFQQAIEYTTAYGPIGLAVGDFNRDGKPDLATANTSAGTASVLLGNGNLTFQSGQNKFVPATISQSVASADLNGDGKLDLVVSNPNNGSPNGTVSVLLGNGNGNFGSAKNFTAGTEPVSVTVGDFNGDGKIDVATASVGSGSFHNPGHISLLLGNGDGTLAPEVDYDSGGKAPTYVLTADMNADGKGDLVISNPGNGSNVPSNVAVLLGNGDGTFQNALTALVAGGLGSLAVGDLNGDGKLDVVATHLNGSVGVLLGNANGTLQAEVKYKGGAPVAVAVGDFNGDGKLDVAAANYVGAALSVFLGNGDGTLQPAVNYGSSLISQSILVGDFNHDGRLDLAISNQEDSIAVFIGNGNGTFQTLRAFPVGHLPFGMTLGDFNSDSAPDLAVANSGTNTITILLNSNR